MRDTASAADPQKFLPVIDIRMKAFLLMNSTILLMHSRQHRMQFIRYSKQTLEAAPEASTWRLRTSKMNWMNWTSAKMKDPKAREPKW